MMNLKNRELYLIGGGVPDDQRMLAHYRKIVERAGEGREEEPLRLATLPTAHRNGLHPRLQKREFIKRYFEGRGCEVEEILIGELPKGEREHEAQQIVQILNRVAGLFVLGGDTRYLLQVLRARKLEGIFKQAYAQGVLFSGSSAGALWLAKSGLSDSESFSTPESWSYVTVNGLGILPLVMNVHDNSKQIDPGLAPQELRSRQFENYLLSGGIKVALALDEFVALHCVNGRARVVSPADDIGAYKLVARDGKIKRVKLEGEISLEALAAEG